MKPPAVPTAAEARAVSRAVTEVAEAERQAAEHTAQTLDTAARLIRVAAERGLGWARMKRRPGDDAAMDALRQQYGYVVVPVVNVTPETPGALGGPTREETLWEISWGHVKP